MAFDLNSISKSVALKAPRLVAFGVPGIGKTSFAAQAPNPIFILTEDGLGNIEAPHFPLVTKVDDVRQALDTLLTEEHNYETVVLDTADHLEYIIAAEIEAKYEAKDLAYGKQAIKQQEVWQDLLERFNALRNDRGMVVIILAHAQIKRFDSPETEPYDRYQMKLSERSAAYLREWCDALLFANYRTLIRKDDAGGFGKTNARGITTGERLLFTSEKPAYTAKNRFSMPESIPMDWDSFVAAIEQSRKSNKPRAVA